MRIQRRMTILLMIITFSLITSTISNLKIGTATPKNSIIDSQDVEISISKNATGIGTYSTLEFTVELTNTLSESVQDINGYAAIDSPYIELSPSTTPVYNTPTLEPEESIEFIIGARVLEEITTEAVDVLLIIDASGSMGEEITSVQDKLTVMIDTLSTSIPELRMGVIVYGWREYSENPMSHSGNQLEFTTDFNAVKDFINALYAGGGYEPWGAALYLANSWDWRTEAQKLIIMVGDEDCDPSIVVGGTTGEGSYNGSDLLDVVTNLKEKEVIINTVVTLEPGVSSIVENQFGWIAAYTGGEQVFLPELEQQGIDLPTLIQEWTLEMSREYHKNLNVTITWEDGSGTKYRNTETEGFWLDFTPPYVVISEKVTPTGSNLNSVEILAEVKDSSDINHVTLYHNAFGGWDVVLMTPIPNSSYYFTEITNLPSQFNLTYFIESSDILNNVGTTDPQWIIVEPVRTVLGEESSFLAKPGDFVSSTFYAETSQTYYLILSGDTELLNSVIVNVTYLDTMEQELPTSSYIQQASIIRKIMLFELSSADIALSMTIPNDGYDFILSYVWVTLTEVTGNNFQGQITDKIRVQGLQWFASNGTYFIVDYNGSSPLVVYGEVYYSNWTFLGKFTAVDEQAILENGTYYIIIWATLRTGGYGISLTTELPTKTYDSYYEAATGISYWGGATFAVIMTLITFIPLSINRRRKV
ncbi:MAG: VWA domain-containing protein [Candidatus Thorarchaeota archaeon]